MHLTKDTNTHARLITISKSRKVQLSIRLLFFSCFIIDLLMQHKIREGINLTKITPTHPLVRQR